MSDRIEANEILHPGEDRWSESREFRLVFQEDSNLVLYQKVWDEEMSPIWASNTCSEESCDNKQVILQTDGNFVLYNADGQPEWQSGSVEYGASSPFIVVQNDGNLCLYDNDVEGCHWATMTNS